MSVDSVGRFYERVMAKAKTIQIPKLVNKPCIKFDEAPEVIREFIGRGFYERMVRLGQRTAEMHLALASETESPDFAPRMIISIAGENALRKACLRRSVRQAR